MTLPTQEQKLEHLREPGSPPAVDAHCIGSDGKTYTIQDQRDLEFWGRKADMTIDCNMKDWGIEARRALREREFCKWFAGLVWELDEESGWDGHYTVKHPQEKDVCIGMSSTMVGSWKVYCKGSRIGDFMNPDDLGNVEPVKRQAARAAFDVLFPEGGE